MEHPHAAEHRRSRPCRTLLVEPDQRLRQVIELELSVRGHSTVSRSDARKLITPEMLIETAPSDAPSGRSAAGAWVPEMSVVAMFAFFCGLEPHGIEKRAELVLL